MSSVEPVKAPAQEYLSADEQTKLRRMLFDPSEFPKEFGAWMSEHIAVFGEFLLSQVTGQRQFLPNVDVVATSETGAPGFPNYGDLTTVGPRLLNMAAGRYLCVFGFQASTPASSFNKCRLNVNGVGSDDSLVSILKFSPALTNPVFAQRAFIVDAPLPSNDIKMEYMDHFLDTAYFATRFLVALRLS